MSSPITLAKNQLRVTNGILIGASQDTINTDLVRQYSNWTPIEFTTTVTNYITDSRNSRYKIDAQTCHINLDVTATVPGGPVALTLTSLPFVPVAGTVYAGAALISGAPATVGRIYIDPATSLVTFQVQASAALPGTEIRIQGQIAYNVVRYS